jgi:hypothetical protein
MPKVETNLTNNTTETNTTVTDDNWTDILNETIEEWDDW